MKTQSNQELGEWWEKNVNGDSECVREWTLQEV